VYNLSFKGYCPIGPKKEDSKGCFYMMSYIK